MNLIINSLNDSLVSVCVQLGATLVVRLWDGHFTAGQLPQPLQVCTCISEFP